MAALPRELIKWLQSLDLSLPVKNAKRDFSNGYIVAEICSRYWAEISLHSFDTGLSLSAKSNNWAQLDKYCRKHNITLPREVIDGVIHQKADAAMSMISIIYTALTGRELVLAPPPEATAVPSYALPTAGQLLREAHPEAHHVERKITWDTEQVQRQNLAILQKHSEMLRTAKAANPEHFKPKPRPTGDKGKSQEKRQTGDLHEITVKAGSGLARLHPDLAASQEPKDVGESVLDLLKDSCAPLLPGNVVAGGNGALQFIIHLADLAAPVKEAVWERWLSSVDDIAEIINAHLQEFPVLVECLQPLISHPTASEDSTAVETLLVRLGHNLGSHAPVQSALLFCEVLLPICRPFLSPHPRTLAKRDSTMRLFRAFSQGGTDVQRLHALQALQRSLALVENAVAFLSTETSAAPDKGMVRLSRSHDPKLYISCLAAVAPHSSPLSDAEKEFFAIQATLALGSPSPTARAASLSLLSTLITCGGMKHITNLLPRLQALADNPTGDSWEVDAQLLLLCSNLLEQTRGGANSDASYPAVQGHLEDALSLLLGCLSRPLPLPSRKVGLTAIAQHISTVGWDDVDPLPFFKQCMAVMVGLPESTRSALLSDDGPTEEIQGALQVYKVGHVAAEWQPLAAAKGLVAHLNEQRKGKGSIPLSLLRDFLEVLALGVIPDQFVTEDNNEDWWQVLQSIGEDLHRALQHPSFLDDTLKELLLNVVTRFHLELMQPPASHASSLESLQDRALQWFMQWPNL